MSKAKIVKQLGEPALLLPALVNEGLVANDRAKYRMTLLQAAREHADHPQRLAPDLKRERLAVGEADAELDAVVGRSRRDDVGSYTIPGGQRVCETLIADVREMLAPLHSVGENADSHAAAIYEERLKAILTRTPIPTDDRISGTTIDQLTSGSRKAGDSLHLLIMDLHKELNRLQQRLATETIDGASVYGITDTDRSLIAAKRTPLAALRIACEQVAEGLIDEATALTRLAHCDLDSIATLRVSPTLGARKVGTGTPASPGVAVGEAVFDPQRAVTIASAGRSVILVRTDISTDDIAGLAAATGILTARGGRTSHAAVVARQLNKVCVVGCRELRGEPDGRSCYIGDCFIAEGDTISLDGHTGEVYAGGLEVFREVPATYLAEVERWKARTKPSA